MTTSSRTPRGAAALFGRRGSVLIVAETPWMAAAARAELRARWFTIACSEAQVTAAIAAIRIDIVLLVGDVAASLAGTVARALLEVEAESTALAVTPTPTLARHAVETALAQRS